MNILILGAGQVGTSVAAALARENNDITVVDTDTEKLRELSEKIDLRVVAGFAAHPSVLARAGAEDADVLVAVTSSDEVNMIACEVAATLYKTPMKIARVRSLEYLKHPELFGRGRVSIDHLISPSQRVCDYIERLIEYPGSLQVLDFADGRAQLLAMRADSDGALVGHQIRDLTMHLPAGSPVRIAAIFRDKRSIPAEGDTVIELGDEVFFLADKKSIRAMMAEFHRIERPARRIMLAGGGNIGLDLARQLENRYSVKIIERGRERSRVIAEALENAIVLTGDCADEDLLREENIDQTDVFCALTNDDEANILSAMLAKRLGARRVISLINRPAYADLVQSGMIDTAVSPQQITLGALLSFVRQGNLVRVHSLRGGTVEALEAVAVGTSGTSRVIGRSIEQIALPKGATIVGVVRGERVLAAHHDTVIEGDDHVILFVEDKRSVRQVEMLFRAGALSVVNADQQGIRNSAARIATALRAVGNVQLIVALTLVPSILLALWDEDGSAQYFIETFALMLALGSLLILMTRGRRAELRLRDGFLVTTAVWLIAALLTPLPLMLGPPHMSYVDAVFEVVSGLTTTGATAIVGIDALPRSVLFYRQSLHFLGGMGIVVLAVAILPTLRVGGAQLTKGETSGPNKDSKLTPRIQQTAAALWIIYCGLNALCAFAYWLGGMNWFDAITHAFATIATGGFGNYDANFAAFDSPLLETIAMVFMMLGGTNFALHFLAWGRGSFTVYGQDPEFRTFLWIVATCCLIAALGAWTGAAFPTFIESLRHASFHVVSMYTSTGFTTTGFSSWPGFTPAFIMLMTFLGACAGSTAGGLKTIRVMITAKLAWRELMRVIHPRAQFVVKVGNQVISEPILAAVAGFVTFYVASYVVLSLAVAATGEDIVTAFSIVASCMNNVGPALGKATATVQDLNDGAVWLCSFAMLLGRLEVFTVLVLLTPAFWRD